MGPKSQSCSLVQQMKENPSPSKRQHALCDALFPAIHQQNSDTDISLLKQLPQPHFPSSQPAGLDRKASTDLNGGWLSPQMGRAGPQQRVAWHFCTQLPTVWALRTSPGRGRDTKMILCFSLISPCQEASAVSYPWQYLALGSAENSWI